MAKKGKKKNMLMKILSEGGIVAGAVGAIAHAPKIFDKPDLVQQIFEMPVLEAIPYGREAVYVLATVSGGYALIMWVKSKVKG